MTRTTVDIYSIINAIQSAYRKYGYTVYGIRTGKAKRVGTYCALSYDGSDYATPNTRLNGTCATEISYGYDRGYDSDDPEDVEYLADQIREAIELHQDYIGEMTYIVAGERAEYGDDLGEIIINNNNIHRMVGARVIAIL
jgi:hypothetical protein